MKLVTTLILAGMLVAPSLAQAQTPATPPDILRELLTEVRGLRQAMERAATVGARIQLLVARVQMQEQRIAEASRRVIAVREQLSEVERQLTAMTSQAKGVEKAFSSSNVSAEERGQAEQMVEILKTQTGSLEKRRQDLANEEALLMQQINADQGRWSDVNGQLDELERTLTPRK